MNARVRVNHSSYTYRQPYATIISMLRVSRNERGSTLTLVMVISTVVGIGAVAAITFLSPVLRFEQNKHLKARMIERMNDLRSCIHDGP